MKGSDCYGAGIISNGVLSGVLEVSHEGIGNLRAVPSLLTVWVTATRVHSHEYRQNPY